MSKLHRSLLGAVLGAGLAIGGGANAKDLTLCWAAWDPANALVELVEGLHREDRHQHEIRVRSLDELRRPLSQRAQLQEQALRSHHRRQPVDRRRRGERPLRQVERVLRQERHQDERLHREPTVVGYSEWPKNTPNYWALPAMGDAVGWTYRKDWFAKPELQKEFKTPVRPRPRAAEDMGRVPAGGQVLPGPSDRRQEGLWRLHLHRARLRRHHDGCHERSFMPTASITTIRRSRTRWKVSSIRRER